MTSTRPSGDWTDDRLDAAFAARAAEAGAAPHRLADEVLASIPTGRRRGPRSTWFLAAAAAVGVAAVVGLGGLLNFDGPRPGPSGPAAASSASMPPSMDRRTPAPTSAVLAALGEPISVPDAIAVRESREDREILVEGFLSPAPAIFCPLITGPGNPTIITCPANWHWLMEQPETLDSNKPTGPAIHPSFALVESPLPLGKAGDPPVLVQLIGHFNDRRAPLCDAMDVCEETFVVDRVLEVDGKPLPVQTSKHTPRQLKDIEEDLDGLVAGAAPQAVVLSRQVVEVGPSFSVEPLLREDPTLSVWDPAGPLWLVTAVEARRGGPIARTFALIDGSDWFAEVTANGIKYLDRHLPVPSGEPAEPLPTGDPSAFDSAPASVLGIPVRDIAAVERARAADMSTLGRDEHVIRAWYVAPPPGATCSTPPPRIHAPTPPCDEARHWLLDDPSQYGIEDGQLRRDPSTDHFPPVLNPLLPVDVPFDVGDTWVGDNPKPAPVVVLGHFLDNRVDTYAGDLYFVIDAIAWVRGRDVAPLDSVVRLTSAATEDVASVLARVAAESPNEAVVTWATVMEAPDVATNAPRDGGNRGVQVRWARLDAPPADSGRSRRPHSARHRVGMDRGRLESGVVHGDPRLCAGSGNEHGHSRSGREHRDP